MGEVLGMVGTRVLRDAEFAAQEGGTDLRDLS
jgi:hypothetical protein